MEPKFEIIVNQHIPGINPIQFGSQFCDPAHSYGPAVRTYWLLHYVMSGSGYFVSDGMRYSLHAGDIFVIPPYKETYYEADGKNPWHYVWIGFSADIELPEPFFHPIIRLPEAGTIFEEMLRCSAHDSGKSAYLCGCLWKLIGALQETRPDADYIEKALDFMHSEYMHGITIQQIADKLGLNRSYFSGLFARRTGMSPCDYLIKLRLTKAAELMILHNESATTAAVSVGYDDICKFSRIFTRHFGVPPSVYKRDHTK